MSLGAVLVAVALAAPLAQAAPRRPAAPVHDQKQEKIARGHFDRAEKAFNLRRFDEALAGYQAAYEALPLPAFLFNIAQCHRNVRNHEQAVFFYQRYLSLSPDASNRPVVEELIAEQKKQLAAQQAAAAAAPDEDRSAEPVNLAARPEATEPGRPVANLQQPPPDAAQTRWKQARWWLAGALAVAVIGGVTLLALRGSDSAPMGSIGVIDARPR